MDRSPLSGALDLSRRATLGLIASSAAGFALLGPRPRKDVPKGRVVLDYWEKWTGAEGQAMQRLVDRFNESQSDIFVRYLSIGSIDQKAMIAVAGRSPPDILGLWSFNIPAFAEALGIPFDILGITVCSVGGTNFTPYVKLLGPEGLNIPHVILTDRDPTNGNHPLVRRRLINVLDVIEGGVDHENLDADEVIELAEQYGYFVNENTLEPELFAGGLAQDMQEVIREELPRLRRETLNALQQWVDDPDQVDEDWLLRLIERIGKGRFAQALAPSVSQDVCPAYIRSALEHIRDAIA